MSALVETIAMRDGAWRRLVLGGGRGNLLSLDLVRALGHLAPHSSVALAHAVAAARLTVRAQAEPALDRAERDYLGGLLKTHDAVEGVQAFLEKRPPVWKNS